MYFLERPNLPDTPDEIFETCISSYREGSEKAVKLNHCKKLVAEDTERYKRLICAGCSPYPQTTLPDQMEASELYAVYDEKFAKKGTAGRKRYYNQIKKQVKGKVCPVCGEKGRITLDHYLPKNEYPTLCVMPDNLLPICMDCNGAKGIKSALRGHGVPVHLYYDRISWKPDEEDPAKKGVYLFVRLGPNFEAEYYVQCPKDWPPELCRRLNDQMRIYELHNRFSEFAVIEMGNLETRWQRGVEGQRQLLKELLGIDAAGVDQSKLFRMMLRSDLVKEESIDPNSWKTALYRAWCDKAEALLAALEGKAAAVQAV